MSEDANSQAEASMASSAESRPISVLAISETFLASSLGLWLVSSGYYWLVVSSLILNLFVHFRSPQSISFGLRILNRSWSGVRTGAYYLTSPFPKTLFSIFGLATIFLGYELVDRLAFFSDYAANTGTYVLRLVFVLNFTVAVVLMALLVTSIVVSLNLEKVPDIHSKSVDSERLGWTAAILLTLISPGLLIAVFVPLFIVRIVSVSRYIIAGVPLFAKNWFDLIARTDFHSPPELIPGLAKEHPLSLGSMTFHLRKARGALDSYLEAMPLALYIPSFIYRFVLKSTFWMYVPVLWAATPPKGLKHGKDDRLAWDSTIGKTPVDYLAMATSVLTLSFLLYRLWDQNSYIEAADWAADNDFPVFWPMYLTGLTNDKYAHWIWLPGTSAFLAILVWIWAIQISVKQKISKHPPSQFALWSISKLNSIKNVLSILTVAIGVSVLLYYFYENCHMNFLPSGFSKSSCTSSNP